MDRRGFFTAAGVSLAGIAAAGGEAHTMRRLSAGKAHLTFKLGCQSGPATDAHFAFLARYGVRNICARAAVSEGRLYSTVQELSSVRNMAERHGLSLDILDPIFLGSTHIDREQHPAIMLAEGPERDRDIEGFQQLIRNCAAAGIPCIKYNMSYLGVLRNVSAPGRGDAIFTGWDASIARPQKPLTRAGKVDADRFWERISYFLDRVVPVAEEYKVRLACHPQDPGTPREGYQGIHNVLGTFAGLQRFVAIRESAFHGLNFCQGTMSENLERPATQIFDVIRWFGVRRKLFNVHFRNIVGHRGRFREAFPDEGDIDMYRALLTYQEVGYDGMLMPDHVPRVPDRPEAEGESFAFAYGHIRGMMQAAEHHLAKT